MRHKRTRRFKERFNALPKNVQNQARKAFRLFAEDMSHPSLAIERIEGRPGIWAGRISQKYRWTFEFGEQEETGDRICTHRVIGKHDEVYRDP